MSNQDPWRERAAVTAIRDGKYALLKNYLDIDINIKYFETVFFDSSSGFDAEKFAKISGSLPLSIALVCSKKEGSKECLSLLMGKGMTIGPGIEYPERHLNKPLECYRTPMNLAAAAENWGVVQLLMDHGHSFMDRDPVTKLLPGEQALLCDEYGMAIKLKVHDGLALDEIAVEIPLSEDFDFGQ